MDKIHHDDIEVDGIFATGKQFDLEIILPEDNREVIYGVVKDVKGHPIEDAVVKLVEVIKMGEKEYRAPISHTFTDKEGDFTFGPLCPNRKYEVLIWANDVKHKKRCVRPEKDFDCLKGYIVPSCKIDPNPCDD
ncbi:MAG: carboxypeptidase regulatory-like domain-containing protein [Clostridia bacterium]|nr:carboxypeptidase regulatory-like domain-containing protein [Clostridia bacterium]